MSRVSKLATLSLLGLASSCSAAPPSEAQTVATSDARARQPRPSAATVSAEVGALDADAVKLAFRAAMPAIELCLSAGRKVIPFLEGEFEAFLRIAHDGSVRWAFPRKSTFGHRPTEQCVIDALRRQSWPKPMGGENGITTQHLGMDSGERPAVTLSADQLGDRLGALREKLATCRQDSGTASLSVTVYVDVDGKALSAGAAVSDEKGAEAIACAVSAANALVYASPGSYPGKFTLEVN